MNKYLLEITVFIAGLGIMVFELIGSRILAPYVGTTIIVWSALIGVILAFLSAGYWWGGKVADRKQNYKYFSGIIFLAALFVSITAFLKLPIINLLDPLFESFRLEAVVLSVILFGPASFFMAAVAPYAVRLRIESVEGSGKTVGELSAIAATGSIAGAFISGMFLVSLVSNTTILFGLSSLLFFSSFLAWRGSYSGVKMILLVFAIGVSFFADKLDFYFLPLEFVPSAYMDIAILGGSFSYVDTYTGETITRPIQQIYTSPLAVQSAMFVDEDDDLVLPYSKYFRYLPEFFNPGLERVLLIGGAGYSIPKDFLKKNLTGTMDVVEIDPKMTEIARTYFNLPDSPRLNIFHEDGRTYLNRTDEEYDAVMIDSFRAFAAPFQLTTLETMQKISNILSKDGVLIVNMVQSIEGESGEFFRAEYRTLKEVFPQVYVFRAISPDPTAVQNIILVATKSPGRASLMSSNPEIALRLETIWEEPISQDMPILTDDFAPVSHYMLAASKSLK